VKIFPLAFLVGLTASATLFAQSSDTKETDAKGSKPAKSATGQVHKATGRVVKVDFVMDEITIVHEPVASLSWPIMRMQFKVRDKKMLDKVKPGNNVDFDFVESGKDYVITDIR